MDDQPRYAILCIHKHNHSRKNHIIGRKSKLRRFDNKFHHQVSELPDCFFFKSSRRETDSCVSDVIFSEADIITDESGPFPLCAVEQEPGSTCFLSTIGIQFSGTPCGQAVGGISSSLLNTNIPSLSTVDDASSSSGSPCNFFSGGSDPSQSSDCILFTSTL